MSNGSHLSWVGLYTEAVVFIALSFDVCVAVVVLDCVGRGRINSPLYRWVSRAHYSADYWQFYCDTQLIHICFHLPSTATRRLQFRALIQITIHRVRSMFSTTDRWVDLFLVFNRFFFILWMNCNICFIVFGDVVKRKFVHKLKWKRN